MYYLKCLVFRKKKCKTCKGKYNPHTREKKPARGIACNSQLDVTLSKDVKIAVINMFKKLNTEIREMFNKERGS